MADLPFFDLAVIVLLGAIYVFLVMAFLIMLFFQFRLILQIWGVIWRAYGLKPWRFLWTRLPLEHELARWRANPDTTLLRGKFRKAGIVVIVAFILFFGAVLVVEFTLPHILDHRFMQL